MATYEEDELFAAASLKMAVDHGTLLVTAALARESIKAILLKGPALAERLYEPHELRAYADTDLLIAEADLAVAGAALEELGYERTASHTKGGVPVGYAETWRRGRHVLDLHLRLPGTAAAPSEVWSLATGRTRSMTVRGHRMETIDDATAALLLSLHVAHHGTQGPVFAREDLRRGLERFDEATWREAASLARRLGADGAVGWGLGQVKGGSALATRLGLAPEPSPTQYVLARGRRPHVTAGLEEIASTPNWSAAARIALAKMFPSRLILRAYGAGPSRRSLLSAWLRRAWLLSHHVPAGIRDFLKVVLSARRT